MSRPDEKKHTAPRAQKRKLDEPLVRVSSGGFAGLIAGHGNAETGDFIMLPPGIYLRTVNPIGKPLNLSDINSKTLESFANSYERADAYNYPDNIEGLKEGHYYVPGDLIYDMNITFESFFGKDTDEFKNNEFLGSYYSAGIITTGECMKTSKKIKVINQLPKMPGESNANHVKRNALHLIKRDSLLGNDASIISDDDIWNHTFTLGSIIKLLVDKGKQGHYFIFSCRKATPATLTRGLGCVGLRTETRISKTGEAESYIPASVQGIHRSISEYDDFQKFDELIQKIKQYHTGLRVLSIEGLRCDKIINSIESDFILNRDQFCKIYNYSKFIDEIPAKLKTFCEDFEKICGWGMNYFRTNQENIDSIKMDALLILILNFIKASKYNISTDILQCIDSYAGTIIVPLKKLFDDAWDMICSQPPYIAFVINDNVDQMLAIKREIFREKYLHLFPKMPVVVEILVKIGVYHQPEPEEKQPEEKQQRGGVKYNKHYATYIEARRKYKMLK